MSTEIGKFNRQSQFVLITDVLFHKTILESLFIYRHFCVVFLASLHTSAELKTLF